VHLFNVVALAGCTALALIAGPAHGSITLGALFDGGDIRAADKIFDLWTRLDTPGGLIDPDPASISVSALTDGGNNPGPGLRYNFNGEMDLFCPKEGGCGSDGDFTGIDFTFRIRTASGESLIKDNSLSALEAFATGSDYVWYVTEELALDATFGDPIGAKAISDSQRLDSLAFPPVSELFIRTTVLFSARPGDIPDDACTTDGCRLAEVSLLEQRFSQVDVPGTLLLLSIGLAAAGSARNGRVRIARAR
jgi:hypothetical protein